MTVHHNILDKFIEDPEYFPHYQSWLILEHENTNVQKSPTQFSNAQLDVESNSQMFNGIIMFTYTITIKFIVQILNVRKTPEKDFGLVIITKIYI